MIKLYFFKVFQEKQRRCKTMSVPTSCMGEPWMLILMGYLNGHFESCSALHLRRYTISKLTT